MSVWWANASMVTLTVMILFFIVTTMVTFMISVLTITVTIAAIVIITYEGWRDGRNMMAGQPGLDKYDMMI